MLTCWHVAWHDGCMHGQSYRSTLAMSAWISYDSGPNFSRICYKISGIFYGLAEKGWNNVSVQLPWFLFQLQVTCTVVLYYCTTSGWQSVMVDCIAVIYHYWILWLVGKMSCTIAILARFYRARCSRHSPKLLHKISCNSHISQLFTVCISHQSAAVSSWWINRRLLISCTTHARLKRLQPENTNKDTQRQHLVHNTQNHATVYSWSLQ